jgi:hypothetical protein
MKLTNNYRFECDDYNFILQKRNVIQDKDSENYGKEIWKNVGYYSNDGHLFIGLKTQVKKDIKKENPNIEIDEYEKLIKEELHEANKTLNRILSI